VIVVGLQTDKRTETSVKHEQGLKAAQKCCKNVRYLECSAMQKQGVKEVFDTAVSLAVLSQTDAGAAEKKMKKPVIYLYPQEETQVHVRVTLRNDAQLIADHPPMELVTYTEDTKERANLSSKSEKVALEVQS
jgi:hypothetical protein